MGPILSRSSISRRALLAALTALTILSAPSFSAPALAQTPSATDPLPSWNDGLAKQAIVDFVKATTDSASPKFVQYLRDNGYKTYIVTGGAQDFVRVYSEKVYDIPPEQVVGTAFRTIYSYEKNGKPFLIRDPKLLLNDNDAGKPEGIHFMIGQRPHAAFGNSTGDRQMLEYTAAGDGARLIVLHDDPAREYAYGPATGLPDTKVGTFTQALYDEAKKEGWMVISMKNDWKRVFGFESAP